MQILQWYLLYIFDYNDKLLLLGIDRLHCWNVRVSFYVLSWITRTGRKCMKLNTSCSKTVHDCFFNKCITSSVFVCYYYAVLFLQFILYARFLLQLIFTK